MFTSSCLDRGRALALELDACWLGQFWLEEGDTRPWLASLLELYEQARRSVARSASRWLEEGLCFQVELSPVEGEETWLECWRFERNRGYLDLADLHGMLSALRIGPHPVRIISSGQAAEIRVTRRAFTPRHGADEAPCCRPVTVELLPEVPWTAPTAAAV